MEQLNISSQSCCPDRYVAENALTPVCISEDGKAIEFGWAKVQPHQTDARPTDNKIGIVLLEVDLPGQTPSLGGFILLDHLEKKVFVRARSNWEVDMDATDREVLLSTRELIESLFDNAGFEGGRVALNDFVNAVRSTKEFSISLIDPPMIAADHLATRLLGC